MPAARGNQGPVELPSTPSRARFHSIATRPPQEPTLYEKVLEYAPAPDAALVSFWRRRCLDNGHFMDDPQLQYRTSGPGLGTWFVRCDGTHTGDNLGTGKLHQPVSERLSQDGYDDVCGFSAANNIPLKEPSTPQKVSISKAKRRASPYERPARTTPKAKTASTSRASPISSLSLLDRMPLSRINAAVTAREPVSFPSPKRRTSPAPAAERSSSPICIDLTESRSPSPSPTRAPARQLRQTVMFYLENGKPPVKIELRWPSGQQFICMMDYATQWFEHDIKPTDVVHILTERGPHGLRIWVPIILGDLILTEWTPGLVLGLTSVSEFHASLRRLYGYAFKGEVPMRPDAA